MRELTDPNPASEPGAALGDVERQLPAVFDSVADGVTVLDRAGIVRFANAAAARLMGHLSPSAIIGLPSSALTQALEMLDDQGAAFDLEQMPTRRALDGERDPEAVIRFRARGSLQDRWSLVRARLLPASAPEDDMVVTSFQDITSLKEVERRLSFLSEASAILGESVDYHESIARVAELAVPFVGDWCVVDVVETTREVRRLAIAQADGDQASADLQALADEAEGLWPVNVVAPGAVGDLLGNGRVIHVTDVTDEMVRAAARDDEHLALLRSLNFGEVLAVPLMGRGQVLGMLTVATSRTRPGMSAEDVAMVEELGRRAGAAIDAARLVTEAQEAVRLRDEFMAIASHDMRTPLAAVRGYAQLARRHVSGGDGTDSAALDRWLGDIDESAARLTGLVSEFMDVSLLRGGHTVPLQLQKVDLVSLVAERVREHQGAEASSHSFEMSSDAAEIIGTWDPARLGRVMDNLLGNAAKFSPDGGEIEVRVGTQGARGYAAVVDHGIGIASRDLALIFTPTYRGLNARSVAGTGLGLAGSRRLVELMGGQISVESRLGHGSTFTVWLPLQAVAEGLAAETEEAQADQVVAEPMPSPEPMPPPEPMSSPEPMPPPEMMPPPEQIPSE